MFYYLQNAIAYENGFGEKQQMNSERLVNAWEYIQCTHKMSQSE